MRKFIAIVFMLMLATSSYAADAKISAMTADASPTSDDLIPTVDAPGTSPANKAVTLGNAITKAHGIGAGPGPVVMGASGVLGTIADPNADKILGWDDSAGTMAYFGLGTGLSFSATPTLDLDPTIAALAGLTIADVSIIEGTGADAFAVVTSGGANRLLGSNSDNSALEFKSSLTGLTFGGFSTTAGIAVTSDGSGNLVQSFTNLLPDTADGAALGSATAEWSDLYLATGGIIYGENDQSNTITSASTGWSFNLPITIGNGSAAAGSIYLKEDSDNGTNTVQLIGPASTADVVQTLQNRTGTVALTVPLEVDGHTDQTALTAEQVSNTVIYNTGQGAADVFLLLPTAAAGYSFLATVGTAQSNHFGVEAGANDKIYLIAADGTVAAGDNNAAVIMTAAQVGQSFACWTFKTDAYDWACKAVAIGTSTFAAHAHSTP